MTWAFPTETAAFTTTLERNGPDDYLEFYEAVLPLLDQVLEYLDQYQARRRSRSHALPLYYLALAFAEAAPHNEVVRMQQYRPEQF